MLNGWIAAGLITALLCSTRINYPSGIFCSCVPKPPVEDAFKYADLVVKGRIIGTDTVRMISSIVYDKKGIRVGRHKFSAREEDFVRVKFVVETNFKSTTPLPDTIYVLTSPESTACGYPFFPYLDYENIPREIYNYIIYGEKWVDKSITTYQSGKKVRGEIKKAVSSNTFATSICMRTRPIDPEELNKLNKIKH
jgi:hypothetical protein